MVDEEVSLPVFSTNIMFPYRASWLRGLGNFQSSFASAGTTLHHFTFISPRLPTKVLFLLYFSLFSSLLCLWSIFGTHFDVHESLQTADGKKSIEIKFALSHVLDVETVFEAAVTACGDIDGGQELNCPSQVADQVYTEFLAKARALKLSDEEIVQMKANQVMIKRRKELKYTSSVSFDPSEESRPLLIFLVASSENGFHCDYFSQLVQADTLLSWPFYIIHTFSNTSVMHCFQDRRKTIAKGVHSSIFELNSIVVKAHLSKKANRFIVISQGASNFGALSIDSFTQFITMKNAKNVVDMDGFGIESITIGDTLICGFTGLHVNIFQNQAFPTLILDDITFTTTSDAHALPIAWIIDVYASPLFTPQESQSVDDSIIPPMNNECIQLYIESVQRARRKVASWLSLNSPHTFEWQYRDLAYDAEGLFYSKRCLNTEGCMSSIFSPTRKKDVKVAVISASYGDLEGSCMRYELQTVETDFICFTNSASIGKVNPGWIIDTTPYHYTHRSSFDDGKYLNSVCRNFHPSSIVKYYKQNFHLIPRLKQYETIIWIDATVEITNPRATEVVHSLISRGNNFIIFEHERNGSIFKEVIAARTIKYASNFWNNLTQQYQNADSQYVSYLNDGYNDHNYWSMVRPDRPQYGLWITCFLGYDMRQPITRRFLDDWYNETLKYTTYDQISFSFVAQMLRVDPYSLPDTAISGSARHNSLYRKRPHGTQISNYHP
jgi:hypothetical protein